MKNIYNWVLNLANKPYASYSLFLISFAEASFFPVPPDVLLIALAIGCRSQAIKFALICSIASILGALAGYGIGHFLWWDKGSYSAIANLFFNHIPGLNEILFQKMQSHYEEYGFFIIFTAGFTPIPFKIITISSGAFDIPIHLFIAASTISRSSRFFLISLLINKFGKKIKNFIDCYFNYVSIIFIIILFSSYYLIKYFIL
jgi:membrane protein YqaA with SNARE-associated domain